ncbi:MAG: O-antigen ligase family protein [Anaerohalosphaeraceae bacterium]
MAQHKTNTIECKSYRLLEGFLLAVVLSVMALRLSFVEQPHSTMQNPALWTTPRGMSLLLSGGLFVVVMAGLLVQWYQGRLRLSGRLLPLSVGVFLVGGVAACFAASDKRAAITELFTLSVPMLMAIAAVGWLDSQRRLDVAAWVILAMGCAAVYVSVDQYTAGNSQVEQDYAVNPQRHLAILGIEPNSLEQFHYEHRLHSKDVRGFLLTSNSTGTFLLAGLFISLGMIVDTLRGRKDDSGFAARLVVQILVLTALAAGLLIGKSRGAVGATMLSAILFTALLVCRRWVWAYRKPILIAGLLMTAAVGIAVIVYGIQHGRLPGPNALYVRWQYWVGAAAMLRDHILTGVGGGNFAIYYPHYKIPAAPETVKDPHQILLSLACQFGPLGLAAFLLAVGAAVRRGCRYAFDSQERAVGSVPGRPDQWMPFGVLAGVMILLLLVRPFVSEGGIGGENAVVQQSVFVLMYAIPAAVFLCAFGLSWATAKEPASTMSRDGLMLGLLCAIVGILIHNLIDFAIFEPGVWTAFWLMLALIMALSRGSKQTAAEAGVPIPPRRVVRFIGVLVAGMVVYHYVWIPVRAGAVFQQGLRNFETAEQHFLTSARMDPLDPDPWIFAGQWRLSRAEMSRVSNKEHPQGAISHFQQACHRDSANFRCYELLGRAYYALSGVDVEHSRELRESSFQASLEAQRRYPGSDRIAYDLGLMAEQMGNIQQACEQFSRAIEIEDQYRAQFAQMYPGYSLCSRLGQTRYEYARAYIEKNTVSSGTNMIPSKGD